MRNYFKGNTRGRRLRIKKIQKKIQAKKWKRGLRTLLSIKY